VSCRFGNMIIPLYFQISRLGHNYCRNIAGEVSTTSALCSASEPFEHAINLERGWGGGVELVKKFTAIYEARRFITVFTRATTGPYPEPHASSPQLPHHISVRYTPLLPFHLRLGLLSCLFFLGFRTKIFYAVLISPISAIYPAHLILLNLITLIAFSEAFCHFLPLRVRYFSQHPVLKYSQSMFFP